MTAMTVPTEDYVEPIWHDGDAPIADPPEYLPPFTGDPEPKGEDEGPPTEPLPEPVPEE